MLHTLDPESIKTEAVLPPADDDTTMGLLSPSAIMALEGKKVHPFVVHLVFHSMAAVGSLSPGRVPAGLWTGGLPLIYLWYSSHGRLIPLEAARTR